jgi:Flp pilus assembly protein TadD
MSSYLISALSSAVGSLFDSATANVGTSLTAESANRASLAAPAMSRGATAAQAGNYTVAIQEFKRAAAYSPADATPYSYLGQVYSMQGKTSEAIEAYTKALKIDTQNDDTRLLLAKAYVSNNDNVNAEKQYLQLAKTNPGNATPPTALGYIYLNSGRLAEADTQFKKVLQIAPTSSTALYNLGLVRNKQGNYDEAVSLFQQAIAANPAAESARADLAYAYIGQDDPQNAKRMYNELGNLGTSTANALASQVWDALNQPSILYNDVTKSDFNTLLGAATPLATLDASLATPGASKVFKMTFVFNTSMDIGSVMNLANWSIGRADGSDNGVGGVYNNGSYVDQSKQAYMPPVPLSVTYDTDKQTATIYFRITQNDTGDAVTDPKHWVFAFNGVDSNGRAMNSHGNQFDGYALTSF